MSAPGSHPYPQPANDPQQAVQRREQGAQRAQPDQPDQDEHPDQGEAEHWHHQ